MKARIAVIGGGPAGCAAAWELHERGADVILFEREPHCGGRTRSIREAGRVLDTGAGFFTNFYPVLEDYLDRLQLRDEVVALSRTNHLVHGGKAREMTLGSVSAFARFSAIGMGAKLRMAAGTGWSTLRHRRSLDLTDPATLAPFDDASIAQYARRTVGEDAYQFLVRPGIEPFWYFSCEDVSRALFMALQARAADAHFFALRHGMDSVCRGIVEQLPACHLGVEVSALERRGDHVIVRTSDAEHEVDRVVIATTATVAMRLVDGLTADWVSADQRTFLAQQAYVPTIQCSYLVDAGLTPPGVSAAFPCGEGEDNIAALSFNSHKHQGEPGAYDAREVVSVYLSATQAAQSMAMSDTAMGERAWSDARAFWPVIPERAELKTVIIHAEAIPVHGVGRYREAAAFLASASGPVAFAGDYLATATVDGALRSGQRAAAQLSVDVQSQPNAQPHA
jgi:oxygen-dependent protoporphyrinogen oxidase